MKISIIIPTINEAHNVGPLVTYLRSHSNGGVAEVIVADGGSEDGTEEVAERAGAKVLQCPELGRALQMNHAASQAKGDVLWFVHADATPPRSFENDIAESIEQGNRLGGYRFRFDSNHPVHRFLSWATRFSFEFTRGGDQTLFVTRDLFDELGGFDEEWCIMEEYDFMRRAKALASFRIIPKDVVVSARKYKENPWYRVAWANFVAFRMYKRGQPAAKIKETYHRMIKHPKDRGL